MKGKYNSPYKKLLAKLLENRTNFPRRIVGGKNKWGTRPPKTSSSEPSASTNSAPDYKSLVRPNSQNLKIANDKTPDKDGAIETLIENTEKYSTIDSISTTRSAAEYAASLASPITSRIDSSVAMDYADKLVAAVSNNSDAFSIITKSVDVAIPLLAGSGVGLPLAAILMLASDLAKSAKANKELVEMLEYVTVICANCYFLELLIGKTMLVFSENLGKESAINIKNELTIQLKAKIILLHKMIADIAPDRQLKEKSSMLSRGAKRLNRFFFGANIKAQILNELTIINSLFIAYNSQFEWIIKSYERKLKNKRSGNQTILDIIWEKIEQSKEYKEYLNPPAPDVSQINAANDLNAANVMRLVEDNTNKQIDSDPISDLITTRDESTPGGLTPGSADASSVGSNDLKGGGRRTRTRKNRTRSFGFSLHDSAR